MPPPLLCFNLFGGCLQGYGWKQPHTHNHTHTHTPPPPGIVFIFAYFAFPGLSHETYYCEKRHMKIAMIVRVKIST
jgi:hypothetical protein